MKTTISRFKVLLKSSSLDGDSFLLRLNTISGYLNNLTVPKTSSDDFLKITTEGRVERVTVDNSYIPNRSTTLCQHKNRSGEGDPTLRQKKKKITTTRNKNYTLSKHII